jgi:hypothetical protein
MRTFVLTTAVIGLAATECTAPGQGQSAVSLPAQVTSAGDKVVIDHEECPPERIRIIRSGPESAPNTIDWDVCGSVRRYKPFASMPGPGYIWVDVTPDYPASSLPAPLPPDTAEHPASMPTALCKDGTSSYATQNAVVCRRHGGLARSIVK